MPRREVQAAIDAASEAYAAGVARIEGQLAQLVARLAQGGMTVDQLVARLSATDFSALILDDLGFRGDVNAVVTAYRDGVLANMTAGGAVTASTLQALTQGEAATYLAEAGKMAATLKQELIRAVLARRDESAIRAALRAAYRPDHAATLANTSLNTYSRAVEAAMAESDPPSARYVYEGPVDDRTRDLCLEMAAAGALTQAEIDERWPGAFLDGGGYNCRHSWVPVGAALEVDPKGAGRAIDARRDAGRWSDPVSFQQQVVERDA